MKTSDSPAPRPEQRATRPVLVLLILFAVLNGHATAAPQASWDRANAYASDGELYGWACDPERPDRVYEIRFRINGALAGMANADVYREAGVGAACGGARARGFAWRIPDRYFDGVRKRVAVEVFYRGAFVATAGAASDVSFPLLSTHPRGWLDHLDKEYLLGWACDPGTTAPDAAISVDFYSQDHGYLGSAAPTMRREPSVADLCGGAELRGFQFSVPASLRTDSVHTVVAIMRNAAGTVRRQVGNGLLTRHFSAAPYAALARMPSVDASNIATYVRTIEGAQPYLAGSFQLASYCYGPNAASRPVSWNPGRYSGFTVPGPAALHQRGLVDTPGQMAMQAHGTTYGGYVSYQPTDQSATCKGYAGINVVAEWSADQEKPDVWAEGLSKEIGVRYDAKIPSASGVAYGGLAFWFDDPARGRSFIITVQVFDLRGLILETFVYDDCPGCAAANPLMATTIGSDNSFGRTGSGRFNGTTFGDFQTFEFRLNGYHLERALAEIGCSNRDPDALSCAPADYRLRLAAIGAETYQNASIGFAIRDAVLFRAN